MLWSWCGGKPDRNTLAGPPYLIANDWSASSAGHVWYSGPCFFRRLGHQVFQLVLPPDADVDVHTEWRTLPCKRSAYLTLHCNSDGPVLSALSQPFPEEHAPYCFDWISGPRYLRRDLVGMLTLTRQLTVSQRFGALVPHGKDSTLKIPVPQQPCVCTNVRVFIRRRTCTLHIHLRVAGFH